MTYYYPSKEEAARTGEGLADLGFFVKPEFEPDNGWVIVAVPLRTEAFQHINEELLLWCEVDLNSWKRLSRRPASHKKPPPPGAKKALPKPPPPPPPPKG